VSMLFALECEDDCGRERRLTWSRGGRCVMANMATGKIPFCNDKGEQALLASLRQHKAVYAEKDALPGCPKKLLELINKCTEYEAEERPSMQAIEAELRDILESIQSGDGFGRPAPWLERGCGLDSRMRLVECGEGSIDHTMIKARVEEEMSVGKVLKVEMNVNLDLFRRYDLERKKVSSENGGDANEVWLWHATRREGAEDKILKDGFDLNKCGLDFEYYGAGVYLACDCKLSNSYAPQSAVRSMLLVRVACGSIYERSPLELSPGYQAFVQGLGAQRLSPEHKEKLRRDKIRELLRMPSNRSCPEGHHSQVGVDMSGNRKSKTEVVVNRSFQAFPAYRVTYQLEPGAALPSPLRPEGKGALKTFDEYLASGFHRSARDGRL
jgi:hypothetical protein